METPQSFGELAILYNCPRTATITADTPVSLWALERRAYKKIMQETDMGMQKERTDFLSRKFPELGSLIFSQGFSVNFKWHIILVTKSLGRGQRARDFVINMICHLK